MPDVCRVDSAIRGKVDTGRLRIAQKAAEQHGVVSRRQLLAMGFSRHAIDRMVAAGYLHPLHRGVYAVGHPKVTAKGRTMAAVLACGTDALASHLSAAWLWDLLRDNRPVTDVSLPGGGGSTRRKGIVLHRPRHLAREDRTVVDGIPCTAVARVLLDIAATRPHLLRRAFEEAERRRVLDLRKVHRVVERSRGHKGAKPLTLLLDAVTDPPPRTRSELEEAFRNMLREEGIEMPAMNVMIGDHEVDAVWFDRKVIVEIDHYWTHGHRTAFERDRIRDAELQIAGFRAIRVTDRQIDERKAVATRLRRLLAA